jgi:hypothetical protein
VEGASGGLGGGGSASASAAAATLGAWVTVQASAPVAFVSPAAARLEWLPPAGLYAPGPVAVTLLWEDCPGVRGWTVGGGLVAWQSLGMLSRVRFQSCVDWAHVYKLTGGVLRLYGLRHFVAPAPPPRR